MSNALRISDEQLERFGEDFVNERIYEKFNVEFEVYVLRKLRNTWNN